MTGSYHNYFRIYDTDGPNDVVLQADKSAFKAKRMGGPLPGNKAGKNGVGKGAGTLRDAMQLEALDFNKKILHASWHPNENTIAVSFAYGHRCPNRSCRSHDRLPQQTTCFCIARLDVHEAPDPLSYSLPTISHPCPPNDSCIVYDLHPLEG